MRIGILCIPGLQTFIEPIAKHLEQNHQVFRAYTNDARLLETTIHQSTVVWFEWANELPIQILQQAPELFSNKTVVIRVHSYEVLHGHVAQIPWMHVDKVICVAKHVEETLYEEAGLDHEDWKDKVSVIPNPLDPEKFSFADRSGIQGFNIGFLANLSVKKGVQLMCQAFTHLCEKNGSVSLHIAGAWQDLRLRKYFENWLMWMDKRMGARERIKWYGFVRDVPTWINDNEINYTLCTSPWESQNLAVMECMLMGVKPLVHAFPGVENIYAPEHIWHSMSELQRLIHVVEFDSEHYRDYVLNKYGKDVVLPMIDSFIDTMEEVSEQEKAVSVFLRKQ